MSHQTPSKKRYIDKYSYVTANVLGQGYSGVVYLGKHQITGKLCAIKIIEKSILKYQAHKSMILCQIEFLTILKDQQKILTLFEVYNTKKNIYIISQLCNTDLKQYLSAKRVIPQSEAIDIIKNVIIGYKSIWKANIVHRDLKPSNILLKNQEIKIADFGFSMFQKDKQQYEKINVGSPYYMPFEVLGFNRYSYKSDIWAIGIIFFQMIKGKTPWKSRTQKQLFEQISQFDIQKNMPDSISQKSKEFLKKTLAKDPQMRLKPQQLIQFNFDQVSEIESIELRNSIRCSKANILQKTFVKTRVLHNPESNLDKEKNIKEEGLQCQFAGNQQNQQQKGLQITEQNTLAQSRMKNLNSQQKKESLQDLEEKVKVKKNLNRKTSLETNYKPFQNQKDKTNCQYQKQKQCFNQYDKVNNKNQPKNQEIYIVKINQASKKHQKQRKGSIQAQVNKNLQSMKLTQKPQNKQEKTLLNLESQQEQKRKQHFEMMKQFSKILRAQIHFCRYIFKLLTKIIIHIPSESKLITSQLKDLMSSLIFFKFSSIYNQKINNPLIMKQWLQTKQWDKIKKVLKQYKEKYCVAFKDINYSTPFDKQKFKKLLRKSILRLYETAYKAYNAEEQKVGGELKSPGKANKMDQNEEEETQIMKIKQQIIILDQLITLRQLYSVEEKYGWQGFEKKANIESIVQGDPLKYIQKKHILAISQKLQSLKIL